MVAITNDKLHNARMRWKQLQQIVKDQPFFESSLLISGNTTPHQVQRQLSDWVKANKVTQLRRGIYAMPQHNPHPFVVANHLVKGSYVSLQMALGYYHLIPEHVAVVTSVTTQRPGKFANKYGRFTYRHIHPNLFFGIDYRHLVDGEYAYIATPEKALLDLIYLQPQGDSVAYINSLRLQQLEILDIERLHQLAARSGKPKLRRAANVITQLAEEETVAYESL